jgi:hypothetical protein
MRRVFPRILLVLLGLVLVAGSAEAQKKKSRGDRNRLTRVELDEAGSAIVTARDAVRLLRPQWLAPPIGRMASSNVMGRDDSPAGGGGTQNVIVYIDDVRQIDLDQLVTVKGADIVEMRYLDQNRAVQMRGPGHEGGVIEVTTVAKRK